MPKRKQDNDKTEGLTENATAETADAESAAAKIEETSEENPGCFVAIDEFVSKLDLKVLYRGNNEKIRFGSVSISRPGLQLAGYYKHFAAERVQVIGEMETAYLQQMMHQARKTACETLMKQEIPCLIVTSKQPPCQELKSAAQKFNRVVLSSHLRTTAFVNKLSHYLDVLLAPSRTIHGVLMDIFGVGVLVIGESGIGKSETALSLIARGHRLVADDAVTLTRVGDKVNGTCPEVIRYFMEVRGIGIIDVKSMYGAGAVRDEKSVDMVVKLETWDDKAQYNRLGTDDDFYTAFDIKIPMYTIPVKPGRNLAVILEAAARNYRLSDFGFNAVDELNKRLRGNFKQQ